ncbi:uncharacterized protein [Diadema antillarum]|uniref:uncharacterized protein n=1 Tax=Diadema antillarum TaxID=105358 RepID=UPI003A8828F9
MSKKKPPPLRKHGESSSMPLGTPFPNSPPPARTRYVNGPTMLAISSPKMTSFPDVTSDDTEDYETACSELSDRGQEDVLERTFTFDDTMAQTDFSHLRHHSPRFIIKPRNNTCPAGGEARFVCCIAGYPLPEISWFASGKAVKQEASCRIRVTNYADGGTSEESDACALVSILDVNETTVRDDGEYTCVAINPHGQAFCSCLLRIEGEIIGPRSASFLSSEIPLPEGLEDAPVESPLVIESDTAIIGKGYLDGIDDEQGLNVDDAAQETSTANCNIAMDVDTNKNTEKMIETKEAVTVSESPVEGSKSIPPEVDPAQSSSVVEVNGNAQADVNSMNGDVCPDAKRNSSESLQTDIALSEILTTQDANNSEVFLSADANPTDSSQNEISSYDASHPQNIKACTKAQKETNSERGQKRRLVRRSSRSPVGLKQSAMHDENSEINEDDVNFRKQFSRPKSSKSRKKRQSSRKRKSVNANESERVRLDLEKAQELTEKVDTCLDIIDDLLNLTSYDENENEAEEKLRQKLDSLVQRFPNSDTEGSSRISTPSRRLRGRPARTDLIQVSDSNGEGFDGSDMNLNASTYQADSGVWGQCSLEDSLKVMAELVGNIKGTVQGSETNSGEVNHSVILSSYNTTEPSLNGNQNNNNVEKHSASRHNAEGSQVKRTPLRELLKTSLFSQELKTQRTRRRPLPATRSLDFGGESFPDSATWSVPKTGEGTRRHSCGSLHQRTRSGRSRHSFAIRSRSRISSTDSSSCDESYPPELEGVSSLIKSYSEKIVSSHSLDREGDSSPSKQPENLQDKSQQFPPGQTLSSSSDDEGFPAMNSIRYHSGRVLRYDADSQLSLLQDLEEEVASHSQCRSSNKGLASHLTEKTANWENQTRDELCRNELTMHGNRNHDRCKHGGEPSKGSEAESQIVDPDESKAEQINGQPMNGELTAEGSKEITLLVTSHLASMERKHNDVRKISCSTSDEDDLRTNLHLSRTDSGFSSAHSPGVHGKNRASVLQ